MSLVLTFLFEYRNWSLGSDFTYNSTVDNNSLHTLSFATLNPLYINASKPISLRTTPTWPNTQFTRPPNQTKRLNASYSRLFIQHLRALLEVEHLHGLLNVEHLHGLLNVEQYLGYVPSGNGGSTIPFLL